MSVDYSTSYVRLKCLTRFGVRPKVVLMIKLWTIKKLKSSDLSFKLMTKFDVISCLI